MDKNKYSSDMKEEIDNILEGFHLNEYDLLEVRKKLLDLFSVSQQRELLIATIEKVRYNLDGYGALTSSEIAERLEKAINCA